MSSLSRSRESIEAIDREVYGGSRLDQRLWSVLVAGVRRLSRAEKDGMEVGDIIVELAGRPVADMKSMREIMKESEKPAKAKIFRRQLFLSITLQLQ